MWKIIFCKFTALSALQMSQLDRASVVKFVWVGGLPYRNHFRECNATSCKPRKQVGCLDAPNFANDNRHCWVRIIPLKYANTRNASEHNRISQEEHRGAERSCHHLFSRNKYFRGVDKSRRPDPVGSPTDDSVCVKCGFNSSWNAPLY